MNRLHRARGGAFSVGAVGAAVMVLAACGGSGDDDVSSAVEIRTLSNRADFISGSDALVEVTLPAGAALEGLSVSAGGRDVTSAFARRADGRITGVVSGLPAGTSEIRASAPGARAAVLAVTNTPRGGPIYSGAQVAPYFCATPTPQAATATSPATNASGLSGTATDAQCNIASETKLWYRTTAAACSFAVPDPSPAVADYTSTTPPQTPPTVTNPCFKPYTPGTTPADLATTTTDAGATVPYIVRVERGTMNRGIYDVAVLFDPTRPWTAVAPQAQWNGKVLYQFGSSTGQPRRQARTTSAWTNDRALSRGYMVVQNSMSDSLLNSNRVLMTETVMMMKEHVIDTYGPVKFAVGAGCSGGSINAHTTASIAPNLLDGFIVTCAYPDSETTNIEVSDCVLLSEAYQKPQWLNLMGGLTQAQANAKKAAVNGHEDATACHGWYNLFGSNGKAGNYFQRRVTDHLTGAITQSATPVNNCQLPTALVYDPATNPTGARCNAWAWGESIWGKVGHQARDTRDNVGVQYGLRALRSGALSAEEFVTLNEIIGGFDRDTNFRAERATADPEALEIAYRAGIVTSGRHLARHAVIDMRGYDDSLTPPLPGTVGLTGIHHVWRSFAIRDRLDRDAGGHDNQVMWRFGLGNFASPPAAMAAEAFATMDQWLTSVKADTSATAIEQKVRAARPASAFDYCVLSTDATQSVKVTDAARCDADPLLNPEASPRQVAGGPRSEDVLKCQLKPISAADYAPALLDAAQLSRLQAVFPQGVCDWSKPGVGQQPPAGPLTFRAGPGGQPWAAAPVSVAQ